MKITPTGLPLPPGPWDDEPDTARWHDERTGYECAIWRNSMTGALCGYVRVPQSHPWYRRDYGERVGRGVRVHGGITYSGRPRRPGRGWWFGFDCAHAWDRVPVLEAVLSRRGMSLRGMRELLTGDAVYRDWAYVKAEVESLALQLSSRPGRSTRQGRQASQRALKLNALRSRRRLIGQGVDYARTGMG